MIYCTRDTALYVKVIFENIDTHEVLKGDNFDMCTCQFLLKWIDTYRRVGKFAFGKFDSL